MRQESSYQQKTIEVKAMSPSRPYGFASALLSDREHDCSLDERSALDVIAGSPGGATSCFNQ
jgi:hypothetical protein